MCEDAWQTDWLFGGEIGRLLECSKKMGKAHLVLQWLKEVWSHLRINHMYFFARKWRLLSKFSCCAMEGCHSRLKRMPCNNGALSHTTCHI